MRRLGFLIMAMLPGAALAEPVVLRVEARRSASVAPVAEGWAERFPAVVTFPLAGGWTGIGIGPMEREQAEAELARLRAAREIPADSFIVPLPEGSQPVQAGPDAPADGQADGAGVAEADTSAPAAQAEAAPPPPPGDFIRLQVADAREAADTALAEWRKDFPEAGLFRQPDGSFAVALGPVPPETAEAWLGAFRAAERVGRAGAVIAPGDLGEAVEAGTQPDLPAPGPAAEMPPLDEVQRALRWAGHYDGEIDGKDGPQTRAAINAEVLAGRATPDAAGAMQALIERRAEWQDRIGLSRLDDPQSGLSVMVPMDRLQFDRNERGLSIYGPKDGSGAALILYGAPGGQQEMLDFTGLVTALGWVPSPERRVQPGHAALKGRNDTHIGQAEARVVEGRVQGVVLIWPVMDAADQPRVAAEILDSLAATPAAPEGAAPDAAPAAGAGGLPADPA